MLSMLVTFFVVSVLLTVMPGPDSLLVVRNGFRGRAQATAVGLGTTAAVLLWGIAAALGLAFVLQQSALAFNVVKYAGAAYLAVLGIRTLWSARKRSSGVPIPTVDDPTPPNRGIWTSLWTGLLAGVANPKTGLFYVAVLPQLVPDGTSLLSATLLFTVIDALVVAGYMSVLAALAAFVMHLLRRPKVLRNAQRVTGVGLLGLATRTALEKA